MKYLVPIFFLLSSLSISAQTFTPTAEQIRENEEAKEKVRAMEGEKFPEFELTTMDGKIHKSEDLLGKIVLLNFWFTACRPCVQEMPDINKIVDEFKDEDIVFIAPTFDEKAKVEKFLTRFDFNYEVVTDVKDYIKENNVRYFPTHFVIDREGYVKKVVIGYSVMTDNMLKKAIKKLLK